ncbi:MAG: dienelactone hydrolase family protein [Candidatus Krumholzibacteriia bacterium]
MEARRLVRRLAVVAALLVPPAGTVAAAAPLVAADHEIRTETVAYQADDTALEGHLALPEDAAGPVPGILVVHEWWGLNDFARQQADDLARRGYVALAVDMYGEGRSTDHPQQATEWSGWIREHADVAQQRFEAARELLADRPEVESGRIGAIGFCFGGHVVLSMAMHGADLDGVVSFHGALPQDGPDSGTEVQARVLVAHGAADAFISEEQIRTFQRILGDSGAEWQFNIYGGAEHSFTNPGADERGMEGLAYSEFAARRSWRDMLVFFGEVFDRPGFGWSEESRGPDRGP